jgi:hypothetical protein
MNEYWALLTQLGLWCWVLSVLIFIHRTFPRAGEFVTSAAIKWGGFSLFFFFCWVAGMLLA